VRLSLRHQEPDRIPSFEWYWTGFIRRWREELGLAADADPYRYYDIDVMLVLPNQDPHLRPFEVLRESADEMVVKTGFGAIVRKVHACPMPEYVCFETDTIDKVRAFTFDDPQDERRYFRSGDSHMHGIGDDTIGRNTPAFVDELARIGPDYAVFGSVIEAAEFMVRSIGQANMMLWIGLYPDEMARFAERINAQMLEIARAQMQIARGHLDGFLLAGDVAYARDLFFSPAYWRKYFKPGIKAIIDLAHAHDLPVIFHGCGNVAKLFEDFIEIGLDGYHPLEVKAGLDVIELRGKLGHRLAFVGNHDVRLWAEADRQQLKAYTLRKLNAAKGGGYLFGSDHSVPASVSGETYDYLVRLVRQYGNYPLKLEEHDIPDL
jgi:hypothetical protein